MTVLKATASVLGSPLLLALILAGLGLWIMRGTRARTGAWTTFSGIVLAYLASTALVGNALLMPLETQYPALEVTQALDVHDIVVLGSGYEPHDHIPVTAALDSDGLARIAEGVRLALARPGARLLVSTGQRMIGGETVMAELDSATAEPRRIIEF